MSNNYKWSQFSLLTVGIELAEQFYLKLLQTYTAVMIRICLDGDHSDYVLHRVTVVVNPWNRATFYGITTVLIRFKPLNLTILEV